MPNPGIADETLQQAVDAVAEHGNTAAAAEAIGVPRQTLHGRLRRAAERGLMGTRPVLPGYMIKSVSSKDGDGAWVKQTKAPGEVFEAPAGHLIKGVSALVDPQGRVIQQWTKTAVDKVQADAAMRAVVAALKEEIPRAAPAIPPVARCNSDLLCQYTITDLHLGMLSWREETGADWDLRIAENLVMDWFAAAIAMAPAAQTAVLAQIGDLLHHDAHESVTPAHRHVLDADSRLQKIIRVVIRTLRRIIAMLLEKHERVHIVMADANHDPAGEAWLREMFAAFYDDEPRVTVDSSASTYYCVRHGDVSLFYHHGHRRKIESVDSVFAGKFREIYGSTKFSYAHLGHLHSDEVRSSNLMKVERHETLAAPDAYAANGGWLSNRSAKVITYHKQHGEVSRITLTPGMVAAPMAANDNEPQTQRSAA